MVVDEKMETSDNVVSIFFISVVLLSQALYNENRVSKNKTLR